VLIGFTCKQTIILRRNSGKRGIIRFTRTINVAVLSGHIDVVRTSLIR